MDSGSVVEALEEKIALEPDSFEKVAIQDDDELVSYGELILLGYVRTQSSSVNCFTISRYNGSLESSRPNSHGRKHRSKMVLNQRPVGNGIKKGQSTEITGNLKQSQAIQDASRHTVSYM
jgi:hypothetical protein